MDSMTMYVVEARNPLTKKWKLVNLMPMDSKTDAELKIIGLRALLPIDIQFRVVPVESQ